MAAITLIVHGWTLRTRTQRRWVLLRVWRNGASKPDIVRRSDSLSTILTVQRRMGWGSDWFTTIYDTTNGQEVK